MPTRLPSASKNCGVQVTASAASYGGGPKGATRAVQERWSDAGGCRMRYLVAGELSNSPPLLLIHGLLGYAFSWRFNMDELAQRRQVYAVDLPGVGFSERRAGLDCRLTATAERLAGFLREQGITQLDVAGTSHGGGVAMLLAALGEGGKGWPRVRRLVLSAPVNPWSRHGRLVTAFLATRAGASLFLRMRPRFARLRGWALQRMYGDISRIKPGTLEGYAAPLDIEGTADHLLAIVRCWQNSLKEIEDALPRIAGIPTLLIWGDSDRAVLPSSAPILQAQFRQAELSLLKGVGHLPYEEVPEAFNHLVTEFLDRQV